MLAIAIGLYFILKEMSKAEYPSLMCSYANACC